MSEKKIYGVWLSMKRRCHSPACEMFKYYGGRGIKVCDRWLKFENFYADMGEPPSKGYSLERINNDGDYCPENCRWATQTEQVLNSSHVREVEFNGERLPFTHWCKKLGMDHKTAYRRMARGMSVLEALGLVESKEHRIYKRKSPRQPVLISHNGTTQSIGAWANQLGYSRNGLEARINRLGVEQALTAPRSRKRRA